MRLQGIQAFARSGIKAGRNMAESEFKGIAVDLTRIAGIWPWLAATRVTIELE